MRGEASSREIFSAGKTPGFCISLNYPLFHCLPLGGVPNYLEGPTGKFTADYWPLRRSMPVIVSICIMLTCVQEEYLSNKALAVRVVKERKSSSKANRIPYLRTLKKYD